MFEVRVPPGSSLMKQFIKNRQPKDVIQRVQWPGLPVVQVKNFYWNDTKCYDYLLFGCRDFTSYLGHVPDLHLLEEYVRTSYEVKLHCNRGKLSKNTHILKLGFAAGWSDRNRASQEHHK